MTAPIRRHYVLPLRRGASAAAVAELIEVLCHADRCIPGLLDSSAAVDESGRTVLWENTFVDEAAYSGPYMEHPYHIAAIDDFLMPDSPMALVAGAYAVRFHVGEVGQALRSGIRRVVLLSLTDPDLISTVERAADEAVDLGASVFAADDVGWVSAKGRAWTHVWEQGFVDADQLERHLTAPGESTPEWLSSLGVDPDAIAVFTCPFELAAPEAQRPAPMPPDDAPVLYELTHRVAPDDAAALVGLLEELYDPFMADNDAPLVRRDTTVAGGYPLVEIQSAWRLESLGAYNRLRSGLATATGWMQFLGDSAPLVKGGRRRFSREAQ